MESPGRRSSSSPTLTRVRPSRSFPSLVGDAVWIDAPIGGESGLHKASQVMIDKIQTLPRVKVGQRIGALDTETLGQVDHALALFLGLA